MARFFQGFLSSWHRHGRDASPTWEGIPEISGRSPEGKPPNQGQCWAAENGQPPPALPDGKHRQGLLKNVREKGVYVCPAIPFRQRLWFLSEWYFGIESFFFNELSE
jgi:hypothetical protein